MKTTYKITRLQSATNKISGLKYEFEVFELLTTSNIQQDLKILEWKVKDISL